MTTTRLRDFFLVIHGIFAVLLILKHADQLLGISRLELL
jgi:hypothetical protein